MLEFLNTKAIYDKVDRLRREKNWTIYGLAKEAGVSSTAIYKWRNNLSSPSLSLLDAVCDAFGMTLIEFLLDGEELITLTEEQKHFMSLWKALSAEQKQSIIELMKSM